MSDTHNVNAKTVEAFQAVDAAVKSLRGLRFVFGRITKSLYVQVRDILAPTETGNATRREILLAIEQAANLAEGSLSCLTKPERARKALKTIDDALIAIERDKEWGAR